MQKHAEAHKLFILLFLKLDSLQALAGKGIIVRIRRATR